MKTFFSVTIIALCWISVLLANIIRVPQDQLGIQAGINAAVNGDTVLVADGTFYENINFKGKAITVASHFLTDSDTTHINNTIINGSQPSHADSGSVVFFVSGEDTTSIIYGFTITGGTGTLYVPYSGQVGGGIFCNNSGCKILASKIINNTATGPQAFGGGLGTVPFGYTAYVVLKDNQIMHNTITANTDDTWGGGVALMCNGIVVNNTISFNAVIHNATISQAASGGLDCSSDPSDRRSVIVESNKITHNSVVSHSTTSPSALSGGVGIYGCQGRFTKNEVDHNELWVNSDRNASGAGMEILDVPESFIIECNIIRENAVTLGTGWGGGINIHTNASPTLTNNIVDGNSATNGGGFLIAGNSTVKLINNTVINNKATSGGGIYLDGSSNVYLMNTIMWANQAPTNAGIHIESGTVQAAYCDIQGGWSGTGNINADPQFVPGDALYHLSSASQCINAGIDSLLMSGIMVKCPSDDYDADDGFQRPYPGTLPDIGADETDVATGVDRWLAVNIPQEYALHQNYPNPFNPSTAISYQLSAVGFVDLSIYNSLGEKVTTLVSAKQPAGYHDVAWEASGFSAGVYFYRLQAGGFVQTRKLLLLR